MVLKYDRQITISTANSRYAENWPAQKMYLSELVDRLKVPMRSQESLSVYLKMPKAKQDNLKDVGGFVGGELLGGRRKNGSVKGRDFISLDLDSIPAGETDTTLKKIAALGCGCCVYSTRKHEPSKPRLRALVWLDRTCSADEYEAISRKLAEIIGIQLCDPSTFQPTRLMYWPSCCSDSQYVYEVYDNPFLSVDGMLRMYQNWRNVAEWPQVPGAADLPKRLAAKQGDPTEKTGIVGAFCRIYDIYRAFELIPGIYEPCTGSDRYTYVGGSTSGGAVIYDGGKFLYSHHATDPCGGRLVNAFDLIRIHKFGELDDSAKADTPVNRLPSYTAMTEFAVGIPEVAKAMAKERYALTLKDFGQADDWIKQLDMTEVGYASTNNNILLLLEHHDDLKDRIFYDEFARRPVIRGRMPWDAKDPETAERTWREGDDAGVSWYMEKTFKIHGESKVRNALLLHKDRHSYNRVKEYLLGLPAWDGVKRLDTLFVDYLGAENSEYVRAVTRKSWTAAVARALCPGTKYDNMTVITGAQGIGKSSLLKIMGGAWFSDSLKTFEGKDACELVQGVWIVEIAELAAFSRAETSKIKHFLSQTEDIFRAAYAKNTEWCPRRCVFFGTTNDAEYLKDNTGDRRFWPIDAGIQRPKKNVFEDLPTERDQIWAEALLRYQMAEPLYLPAELMEAAQKVQEAHRISDDRTGVIQEFLELKLPKNWSRISTAQRRIWLNGGAENEGEIERDRVCVAEIWTECLGQDLARLDAKASKDIRNIMDRMPGWKKSTKAMKRPPYGVVKGYEKEVTKQVTFR